MRSASSTLFVTAIASLLSRKCLGDFSSLYYYLSSESSECTIQLDLDLGSSNELEWNIPTTSESSYKYVKEYCEVFDFYTCDFDQLVFPVDGDGDKDCYECPGCPCTQEGDVQYQTQLHGEIAKECYICECVDMDETNDTQLAWRCDWEDSYTIYWYESEYEQFECPFSETRCVYNGETYPFGSSFTAIGSDGSTCSQACYCDFDGTVTCEDANSLDTDSALYQALIDDCQWSLAYCLDDPTQWVFRTSESDDRCYCPRCGCTAENDDVSSDVAFTLYEFDLDIEYEGCATGCYCRSDYWRFDDDVVYCEDDDTYLAELTCPVELKCLEYDYWGSSVYSDLEGCFSPTQTFCANRLENDFGAFNGTMYTVPGWEGGCYEGVLCEIAGVTDNECVSYDVSFTTYVMGCDGGEGTGVYTENLEFTDYLQCCQGDYCNNVTVSSTDDPLFDTATCSKNEDLGTLFSSVYACQTSQEVVNAIGETLYCNSFDWFADLTACEYLDVYISQLGGCYCSALGEIYDGQTSGVKTAMQNFIDQTLEEMNFITAAYTCDLTYACNLGDSLLEVTYTEYLISFELTLTNFNSSTYDEDEVSDFIANVIGVSSGNIALSDVTTTSSSVSMIVTVTFDDEDTAEEVRAALQSDASSTSDDATYDFGEGSSVTSVSSEVDSNQVTNIRETRSFAVKRVSVGFVVIFLVCLSVLVV